MKHRTKPVYLFLSTLFWLSFCFSFCHKGTTVSHAASVSENSPSSVSGNEPSPSSGNEPSPASNYTLSSTFVQTNRQEVTVLYRSALWAKPALLSVGDHEGFSEQLEIWAASLLLIVGTNENNDMEVLLDPGDFDTSAVDIDTPGNYAVYVPLSLSEEDAEYYYLSDSICQLSLPVYVTAPDDLTLCLTFSSETKVEYQWIGPADAPSASLYYCTVTDGHSVTADNMERESWTLCTDSSLAILSDPADTQSNGILRISRNALEADRDYYFYIQSGDTNSAPVKISSFSTQSDGGMGGDRDGGDAIPSSGWDKPIGQGTDNTDSPTAQSSSSGSSHKGAAAEAANSDSPRTNTPATASDSLRTETPATASNPLPTETPAAASSPLPPEASTLPASAEAEAGDATEAAAVLPSASQLETAPSSDRYIQTGTIAVIPAVTTVSILTAGSAAVLLYKKRRRR